MDSAQADLLRLMDWCQVGVIENKVNNSLIQGAHVFPANYVKKLVEPRGFEPLTSAVQRRRSQKCLRRCVARYKRPRNQVGRPTD